MGGSVKQMRKGMRSNKAQKAEVINPNQQGREGSNKMTKGQSRPATTWLKD